MMYAVQLDEPNGQLMLREIPVPRPRANQVLVRMAAAPLNPSDIGALAGSTYSGTRKFPFTPGVEGSGTVVEAGEGWMPRLLKGRRVACAAQTDGDGTWAEYMVTSAGRCVPLRRNVSMEQGAMLLVNPLSALAILEIAGQGKHRAIVSTAAASALGGMLLKLGARRNIRIIHVVRRREQVELVRGRGGQFVLNSSDPDFVEQLRELASRVNATLLLDAIGDRMTGILVEAAPYGSTVLLYARLSGKNGEINSHTILAKHLQLKGWFLGNWLRERNLLRNLQLSGRAQSLLATDLYSPVRERLPLAAAQAALDAYVGNMTAGKILLVADPQQVPLE
jgi:NADPH:quinone reductase-like Zn-dependent oxidoreductase